MRTTPLRSAAEVLVATDHHPFARGSLRRQVVHGWVAEGATAWMGTDSEERLPYLSALGAPAAVGALLTELLPALPPRQRVTVPRGTPVHLPAWVGLAGTDWDFRWTAVPPTPQSGESLVVEVDDEPALKALLAEASPTASAQPGDEAVRRWVGVHGPAGRLLACAADTSAATGVGHLSAIAVHPQARGRGLGKAVVAALSRRLLDEGCDVVALGMYADNTVGRALYDALGFADDSRFTSGPLLVRGRW
jgi:ribosomal protein S18 acetylase RimI-like enzyme